MLQPSFTVPRRTSTRASARSTAETAKDGTAAERILCAAEQCLRENTYAGVSLRRIAKRAGVSKSLVLYHFESKERLFAELQLRVYRRLARSLTAAATGRGTPVERARFALASLIAVVREENDIAVHAMLATRALWDAGAAPHVSAMRRELRELLHRTMHEIFAGDAKRLPVPLETTADLLWAALTGLGMEAAIEDSPLQIERGFDALRAFAALAFAMPEAPAAPGDLS
jgi:AcrR family transcriptional regulator